MLCELILMLHGSEEEIDLKHEFAASFWKNLEFLIPKGYCTNLLPRLGQWLPWSTVSATTGVRHLMEAYVNCSSLLWYNSITVPVLNHALWTNVNNIGRKIIRTLSMIMHLIGHWEARLQFSGRSPLLCSYMVENNDQQDCGLLYAQAHMMYWMITKGGSGAVAHNKRIGIQLLMNSSHFLPDLLVVLVVRKSGHWFDANCLLYLW